MLLHTVVDTVEMLILGLYISPPATIYLLKSFIPILARYPTDNLIIAGDFNMVQNPSLDRLTSVNNNDSPLQHWASLYGLTDIWRWKFPTDRAYTCHSTSYCNMSRIDLVYVGGGLPPLVHEVSILPRGISDHDPVLFSLRAQTPLSERLWRLSPYWISDWTSES